MIKNDIDIEQGILLCKVDLGYQGKPALLKGDYSYSIYPINDDVRIGTLSRENHFRWNLSIPGARINLSGQYRTDLIVEAEMLYRKHIGK